MMNKLFYIVSSPVCLTVVFPTTGRAFGFYKNDMWDLAIWWHFLNIPVYE